MARDIKRIYTTKPGFRLVRNNESRSTDDKFQEFILYLWRYIPSGILRQFAAWLSSALCDIGLLITTDEIDNAMSKAFMANERARKKLKNP